MGRTKAQAFLQNTVFGLSGPMVYTTEPIRPLAPNLAGIQLSAMDPGIRTNVRDRLRNRADAMMHEAGMNWATREAVDLFFIKPQLDKLLQL